MERQKYNKLILERLSKLVDKYPNLRFGQILINTDVLKVVSDESGFPILIEDPYSEEPNITWDRMCINRFVFPEKFN